MRKAWLLSLLVLGACSSAPPAAQSPEKRRAEARDLFAGGEGCFLLYNLRTKDYEQVHNKAYCYERSAAADTFAAPAAVLAAEAGLEADAPREKIAEKLGRKKVKSYLQRFGYGNRDFASPKISAIEQADFLERLWRGELPASKGAQEAARDKAFRPEARHGFRLRGLAGSGEAGLAGDARLGWFAGHLEGRDREYLVVTRIATPKGAEEVGGGGTRAEEITKELLEVNGLW